MNKFKIHTLINACLVVIAGMFSACENDELTLITYPEQSVEGFSPTSGRPGTMITISGTDFGEYAPAVTVWFNGLEAEVDSVTNTMLQLRVPNEATSGLITVKVWTHTVETESEFTVIPGAKVSFIAPASGEAGDEVTISGESFGTDANAILVYFENGADGVQADIVSITETEIVVTVPEGGITGAIRLVMGVQDITGPVFTYPFAALQYTFDTSGDAEGWTTSHNSTNIVDFGVVRTSFDMSASKRRADFGITGGVKVHAGVYPIVAIRMIDKPSSGNFIFDTNLGKYKNGSNNWDGIIDDNIYYFDLRNTFGEGNTLSQTEETTLSTFQWKVADIITDEKGYFVDWVRSFASVEALESHVQEQYPGQKWYGFSGPERTIDPAVLDDWMGKLNQSGTITDIDGGYAKVTFGTPSNGTDETRADFNYSNEGKFGEPTGPDQAPWQYDPEYPIYGIKLHFVQSDGTLGGPRPAIGTVRYDRLGNFDNTYAESNNVLWVDASSWGGDEPKSESSTWAVVIADILSDEIGYWVDWHRQYRSVEEMEFYLGL